MINLAGFAAFVGIVAASSQEPGVNVTCSGDNDVVIDIGYDRSADLLKLSGGSCNASSVDYVQNNVTNAIQITLNMRDCGLRSAGEIDNDVIAFESSVEVSLGRSDNGVDMVFYYNKVNLTCNVQVDYEVSVSYGQIDADYSGDEDLAGGEKAYNFGMRSTDSKYNETVVPSNRAGDTVYLDVFSSDLDFFRYKFSIPWCTFSEMNGDSSVTEYNLFNHTQNSCKNNFLDFSIKYCNSTNAFKISHTVFTFDPSRENNYTLTCGIKLCDFDVAASSAKCEAFENNCGIDTIMPNVPMVPSRIPNVGRNSSVQNLTSNATVSANSTNATVLTNSTTNATVSANVTVNATVSVNSTTNATVSGNATANATMSVNSINTANKCEDQASDWIFMFQADDNPYGSVGCETFFADLRPKINSQDRMMLDNNLHEACGKMMASLYDYFQNNLFDSSGNGLFLVEVIDENNISYTSSAKKLNEICQKACANKGSNPSGCTV